MTDNAGLEGPTTIQGMIGTGKTVTGKRRAEQMLDAGWMVCIIDPTGVWNGLRLMADGETPGYEVVIFGGPNGDIPIKSHDGEKVANIIDEMEISCIIDLSDLFDVDDQHEFMESFTRRMMGKGIYPFNFIIDEADEFCPQTTNSNMQHQLRNNLRWIAKRGRVKGFRLTTITQRPASIDKDIISMAQTFYYHQFVGTNDRKAVEAALNASGEKDQVKNIMAQIAGLKVGERICFSPQSGILERGKTKMIETFDSSKAPEQGEKRSAPPKLSQIDLGSIAELLREDDEKDVTGEERETAPIDAGLEQRLRSEIEHLENRIVGKDKFIQTLVSNRSIAKEFITTWGELWLADNSKRATELDCFLEELKSQAELSDRAVLSAADCEEGGGVKPNPVSEQPSPERSQRPVPTVAASSGADLTKSARKMIDALAELHPRAVRMIDIAKKAGVSMNSSAWGKNKASFEDSGYVDNFIDDRWRLSLTGRKIHSLPPLPESTTERLLMWVDAYPPATGKMLSVVVEHVLVEATGILKEEIAERAGVSLQSSGLSSGLKDLVDNGLIKLNGEIYQLTEHWQ